MRASTGQAPYHTRLRAVVSTMTAKLVQPREPVSACNTTQRPALTMIEPIWIKGRESDGPCNAGVARPRLGTVGAFSCQAGPTTPATAGALRPTVGAVRPATARGSRRRASYLRRTRNTRSVTIPSVKRGEGDAPAPRAALNMQAPAIMAGGLPRDRTNAEPMRSRTRGELRVEDSNGGGRTLPVIVAGPRFVPVCRC